MKIALAIFCFTLLLHLNSSKIPENAYRDFCESLSLKVTCDPTQKYRPINGRCNNLERPFLGAAYTPLKRMLKTQYSDKISSPTRSVTGDNLPSARLLSLTIFNDTNIPMKRYTQALVQFIQFVAHDISHVQSAPKNRGCCKENGRLVSKPDKSCMYIPVPPGDLIHRGMKCLDFTRSFTDRDLNCPGYNYSKPAQQINTATSSWDLSTIYGVSDDELSFLRSFVGGKLKVNKRYDSTWPQQLDDCEDVCFVRKPRETCFFSGDTRINQNPQLTIVHILFIREHNRIATELHKINPHWSDEVLFQEARRINIATLQNIGYYGWIGSIVGEKNMRNYGLYYQNSGGNYASDYNSSIDLSILNEFTSAMFRLPHTLIEGRISKLSSSYHLIEKVRLSDAIFRPKFIEGYGTFESYVRGMLKNPAQEFDSNYDPEVRSYLFKKRNVYGNDLKAIDIQRGRDHGIGSYNDLREFCKLPRAKKWEDFGDIINVQDIENMKKVYADVNDVDLNVGATLEKPFVPGTILGYTYACMFVLQIRAMRSGDRFWFETDNPAIRFTPEQLTEIRKTSFSRIVCDNAGDVTKVPKNPFVITDGTNNYLVECSDVPSLDLKVFKEENQLDQESNEYDWGSASQSSESSP